MIYAGQWKLLSGRIRGLMQVAHFHASLAIRNSDSFGRGKYLGRHCGQIRDALASFRPPKLTAHQKREAVERSRPARR
jgi:hypothetical protein